MFCLVVAAAALPTATAVPQNGRLEPAWSLSKDSQSDRDTDATAFRTNDTIFSTQRPILSSILRPFANGSLHYGSTTLSNNPQWITVAPLGNYTWAWELGDGMAPSASRQTCSYADAECTKTCGPGHDSCYDMWQSWSITDVAWSSKTYASIVHETITESFYSFKTTSWLGGQYYYMLNNGTPTSRSVVTSPPYTLSYFSDSVALDVRKPPPSCTWTSCTIERKIEDCSPCEVQGGTVDLLYWQDLATTTLKTQSEWRASGSRSITAIYKNITLTSPTVYIEFQTAYAINACGTTVGKPHPGAILALDPKSLKSVLGNYDRYEVTLSGSSTSTGYMWSYFNFRDLSGFVPPSAYAAQPSCIVDGCYTIYNDEYRPVLVVPSEIRALDPAWKTCGLDWQGLWDPPKTLKPAATIDSITTPSSAPSTTPASPQPSITSVASQTAGPETSTTSVADPTAMGTIQSGDHFATTTTGSVLVAFSTSTFSEDTLQVSASNDGASSDSQSNPPATSTAPGSVTARVSQVSSQPKSSISDPTGYTADASSKSIGDAIGGDPVISAILSGIRAAGPASADQSTATHGFNSDTAPITSQPSPSNAYQGLSEALGTATSTSQREASLPQSITLPKIASPSATADKTASTASPGDMAQASGSEFTAISSFDLSKLISAPALSYRPASVSGFNILDSTPSSAGEQASIPHFAAIVSIGSETLTAAPWHATGSATDAGLTMDNQTLTAGGRILTSDGHTFSAEETGLVFDGNLLPFTEIFSSSPSKSMSAIESGADGTHLTVGDLSGGIYEVGGATLSPGGPGTTLNGHTISIGQGGAIEVDGSTMTRTMSSITPASEVAAVVALVSTTLIFTSAIQSGAWLFGGSTISPGAAPVLTKGHTFSVGSSGVLEDGSWIPPTLIHYTTSSKVATMSSSVILPVVAIDTSPTITPIAASSATNPTSTSTGAAPSGILHWAGIIGGALSCLAILL